MQASDPTEFFTVQLTLVLQKLLKGIPVEKATAVAIASSFVKL